MTTKSNLETQGNFRAFPAAELFVEISIAGLHGSLKASHGEKKAIFYFESGKPVYAVSNERAFRLATILLEQNVIDRQFLAGNSDVTNDLQMSQKLVSSGRVSTDEMNNIISGQCESIVAAILAWQDGEWTFSPHARIKSSIGYNIEIRKYLVDYSRRLSSDAAATRLSGQSEWFEIRKDHMNGFDLQPHEAFVLSRFDGGQLSLSQLIALGGLPPEVSIHTVYCLWLSGCLTRHDWNSAISKKKISNILTATLELKKPAQAAPVKPVKPERPAKVEEDLPAQPEMIDEFNLEEELVRIESARNYYEVLSVERTEKLPLIRRSYFRLAKQLHPDRHHNESPEILKRVEHAFTEVAQAHDTLKSQSNRQNYDIKLTQEEKERASGQTENVAASKQEDQAAKDFERGFNLQLEGNFEEAMPYLARAVHYAPGNARYHAFYGKTLSADETQRHKAEKELSIAVQLEPQNESFRLMLAEFFIRFKLVKRAEGELNRLLAASPNNRQARALLDSLQVK
jgi:curved DNA-binding protein CbpA